MNNCEQYIENISAYIDGELNKTETLQIESHLKNCKQCSALLAFYREISTEINNEQIKAPAALRIGVMEKIRAMPRDKSAQNTTPLRKIMKRYVPLAACLAVAILLVQIMPAILNTHDDDYASPAPAAFFAIESDETALPAPATAAPEFAPQIAPAPAPSPAPAAAAPAEPAPAEAPPGDAMPDRRPADWRVGGSADFEAGRYDFEEWGFGVYPAEIDGFVYYDGFFAVIYLQSDQRLPPDITIIETWYEPGRTFKAISRQDAAALLETDIPAVVVRGENADARETALVITLYH